MIIIIIIIMTILFLSNGQWMFLAVKELAPPTDEDGDMPIKV